MRGSGLEDEALAVIEGEPEVVDGGQADEVFVAQGDDDSRDGALLEDELKRAAVGGGLDHLAIGELYRPHVERGARGLR